MNVPDPLAIGINSGFLFIPFAIGINLIYQNLKEIDVSIDGVIIISGIASAIVWNTSDSYLLSIMGGMISGIICSSMVAMIQAYLSVPSIMAGLVFSLIAHTTSIFIAGESLPISGSRLIPSVLPKINIQFWHAAVLLACYLITIYTYNTHLGLSIKKYGSGIKTNLNYSVSLLRVSAYAISGAIYGIGAAIFVHSRGQATGGTNFEYLVQALTAVLLASKFIPEIEKFVDMLLLKIGGKENLPGKIETLRRWFGLLVSYRSLVPILGAIGLEIIIEYVISVNPSHPQMWKLVLSITLLVVLSTIPTCHMLTGKKLPSELRNGIVIKDLQFSYDYLGGTRKIFEDVDLFIPPGLSILSGANGSGKTTLLKLLTGELESKTGVITFNGIDITLQPSNKRPVFMLTQNPLQTLVGEMTVQENLFLSWQSTKWYSLNTVGIALRTMLPQLKSTGLSLFDGNDPNIWSRPINSLSGGQAYCVAIYCAILSGKAIIGADEPTTGLDSDNYQMVRNVMTFFSGRDDSVLLIVTHDERLKDISWSKFRIRNYNVEQESNWWDARYKDTFFQTVYRLGDNSREGFIRGKSMDLYLRTKREVQLIENFLGNVTKKQLLDCPCGYGRHAIELAKRGVIVVGVDICPESISEARKRAVLELPEEKRPKFLEGDMQKLPEEIVGSSFDYCINMFLSFGFFDDEGNKETLKEYGRVLKKNGKLIIHTDVNPDQIANGTYGDLLERSLQNGMFLRIDESFNKVTHRLEGSWSIMNGDHVHLKQKYSIRIYSHAEIQKLLQECGFDNIEIHFPDDTNKQEVIYYANKT